MDLARQIRQFWRRFDKGWVPGAILSAIVFAICVFVAIKTLVRCTVGVVLVLVWLGGVVMILETTSSLGFAGPAFLALSFSLFIFWTSYKFVVFMDKVSFPTDHGE